VLAKFARTNIHFEDSKTEPSGDLMVFLHGEANLDPNESTTGRILGEFELGIGSRKSRQG
jgi:hypothetical protein